MPELVLPITNILMNLAPHFYGTRAFPSSGGKASGPVWPCSSSATGQNSALGQRCKLGDTSSSQRNCQAILHQTLCFFVQKGGLALAKRQHTKQSLCQDFHS